MRGHAPILALRRHDQKPADELHFELAPWPKAQGNRFAIEAAKHFRAERIFVETGDPIDRLDLGFVVGLDIVVHGEDSDRVRRLYTALQRHKARRVIANCGRVVNGAGRLDFVLDTLEILTWHA